MAGCYARSRIKARPACAGGSAADPPAEGGLWTTSESRCPQNMPTNYTWCINKHHKIAASFMTLQHTGWRRLPGASRPTGPTLAARESRRGSTSPAHNLDYLEADREIHQNPTGGRRACAAGIAGPGPAASDQGRRAAFAVRHHGDQRDDAEGHRPDADRRAEQEGRPARPQARGGRRRPGLELAAVRREGARAHPGPESRQRVRLLDLGVAQVGAAGVQGAERPAVLPGAVRG